MQPVQCNLRCPAAKDKSITHAAVAPSNLHAAITLRSATRESRNAKNYAHMNNHSLQNTEEEPIALGWTAAAPVAHRRYLSSPAGATLHRKTQGFLPRLSPKMKPMQHPCSHYNAFCNIRLQTRISRRTWQQSDNNHALQSATRESRNAKNYAHMNNHSLQNTEEEPIALGWTAATPVAHRRYLSIAGRSHFTRKHARFPAPAFPQNEAHATSMQPLQCVLQHQVVNPHLLSHMATQNDNNHAAITLQSATRV